MHNVHILEYDSPVSKIVRGGKKVDNGEGRSFFEGMWVQFFFCFWKVITLSDNRGGIGLAIFSRRQARPQSGC